jgi:hypothetical protein
MPSERTSGGPQRRPDAPRRVSTTTRSLTIKPRHEPDAAAPVATPHEADAPGAASIVRSALSVITTVGTPLTIITALMLYFGWARSSAQSSWMGIDVSLFHFSAQDYVLRSISTLFVPLLVAGVVGIVWLELHRRAAVAAGDTRRSRVVRAAGMMTMYVGIATASISVALAAMKLQWPLGTVVFPLLLAGGTALATYGRQLKRLGSGPAASQSSVPRWQVVLQNLLIGVIIALAVFWAVGEYAGIVGRGFGQEIEGKISSLPEATAISEAPLGIDAPNVATSEIAVGSKTLYRTTGLRLLGESGGRLFLLNDGWSRRTGSIIVLEGDKSVHWQFAR